MVGHMCMFYLESIIFYTLLFINVNYSLPKTSLSTYGPGR